MTTNEKNYVAGIFDHGAHFYPRPDGKSGSFQVHHRDRTLPAYLRDTLGCGSIERNGKGYRWTLYSAKRIHEVLLEVGPYMLAKGDAVQKLVEWSSPDARRARRAEG